LVKGLMHHFKSEGVPN